VHKQKTGGTSISTILSGIGDTIRIHKHASLTDHITRLNDHNLDHETFFKFSVQRNPWDLAVSHYIFDKDSIQKKWDTISHIRRYKIISECNFSQYIKRVMFYGGSYDRYMCHKGEYMLDYVCRFETLQQDFDTVCDKTGIPRQQLPYLNKTNHKHYTEYYNDETRQIVADHFAKDIKYFGHKFGK
jgi:hypothetical protein